nr:hypothetical protein [Tanacetum cinerariifolium]
MEIWDPSSNGIASRLESRSSAKLIYKVSFQVSQTISQEHLPSISNGRVSLLLTDQIDLVNPKGNQVVPNVNKPVPLGGPPAYDISHWWFKHKEFYITRHNAPFDRREVRSHMRILSVVSIKTFSGYNYTYLKEIVLRRADYKEYKISKANFKNLHLNDFEDMYLLHLQGNLNRLHVD